jgi:hypothetical protein
MKKLLSTLLLCLFLATPASAAVYALSGFTCVYDVCWTTVNQVLQGTECMMDCVSNHPTHQWTMCKVECVDPSDYIALMNESSITMMPSCTFDMKMSAMPNECKTSLENFFAANSIPYACLDSSDSYREVVRCIGQQNIPTWNENYWAYF